MQTPDPMFAIFCGTPRDDLNRNKNTIKAGGSTAICKMSTGWMDTPQTVTTTRAPCGAKNIARIANAVQVTI